MVGSTSGPRAVVLSVGPVEVGVSVALEVGVRVGVSPWGKGWG